MVLDAGSLRERVTIQRGTETRNRLGESRTTWSTFTERWASVQGLSSRESLLMGQQKIDATHRVRVRYVDGLTQSMRLVWRGRTLEIVTLLEHNNRSEHELICQERVE